MKITAHCASGLSGQAEHYQVDTALLHNGSCIEALLDSVEYLPAARPPPLGADIGQWHITLDNGRQQHTVAFVEDGSAAALPWQTLLTQLRASAETGLNSPFLR
ncbi:hypothetical protein [Massilia sp. CF038]|uniref:hypothetical protein n=1 Tax=Massilia sp. CF038 TaxID=1881045 RepID=UPI00091705C1|nr:hypothetical protein [Massilia sp. CF038]SHH22273.1 hypothetical protein SAMN05428948_3387 [Massilia sp. CF038]